MQNMQGGDNTRELVVGLEFETPSGEHLRAHSPLLREVRAKMKHG